MLLCVLLCMLLCSKSSESAHMGNLACSRISGIIVVKPTNHFWECYKKRLELQDMVTKVFVRYTEMRVAIPILSQVNPSLPASIQVIISMTWTLRLLCSPLSFRHEYTVSNESRPSIQCSAMHNDDVRPCSRSSNKSIESQRTRRGPHADATCRLSVRNFRSELILRSADPQEGA